MKFRIILFQLALALVAISAQATTYYVNSSGNDANTGTTGAQAWRTTARVNAATLLPGDRVVFAGGETFTGSLRMRSNMGTAAQPIIFRSYGTGQAIISSGADVGFYAHNTSGFVLRNLAFVGAGRLTSQTSGVQFYNDSTNANLQYLRFDSLDVSGYLRVGLEVGSWNGTSGYDDVRITNCQLHANGEAGLSSYAYFPEIGHHNWFVGNCAAYDNSGRPELTNSATGNGIVLSGIDGAMIDHCTAYHNGWLNSRGGGPAGIWGWDCNDLTIQYCESHHNEAGGHRDGGGFDLDGGCTNSVLQYNYSHDNDGPGYLLVQFDYARAMHDLTVRYNISQNDARQQEQGGILIYSESWLGGIVNADFYNNTIILDQPTNGTAPSGVYLLSGNLTNVTFRNNIIQTGANLRVLRTFTTSGVRFEGNSYWSTGSGLTFDWNTTPYYSLAAWQSTGQETLTTGMGTRPVGMSADPGFASSGTPPFTLSATSPLLGQGLNLFSEFNLNPGPRDYYGNKTPTGSQPGNIGASEARPDIVTPPLPVELVRFMAAPMGSDALVRWATATEKNNDRFEVEASTDARTFRRIGQVAGHGSSTQPHDYQFIDAAIARYAATTVYYRLRQVDRDGTATYSSVQAVAVNQPGRIALFPNPATGAAALTGVQAGAVVKVFDALGRQVFTATADATGTAALVFPRGLAAGVYQVRVGTSTLRLNVE